MDVLLTTHLHMHKVQHTPLLLKSAFYCTLALTQQERCKTPNCVVHCTLSESALTNRFAQLQEIALRDSAVNLTNINILKALGEA